MNSRSIGKLVSISQRGIVAEMYESLGNYINTMDGIRFVGDVGSYVSIYDIGRIIIGEITGVEENPVLISKPMSKPNSSRLLNINLIGEIISNKFFFGVSKMPLIFSEVNIISENDLITMLEVSGCEEIVKEAESSTRAKLLAIGSSVIFPDYSVKVNIDRFFGFHFAVFGNTGAGKSNTVATILQRIFLKTNYSARGAKFVIVDSNGEYAQAFSLITSVNPQIRVKSLIASESSGQENRLEIPVWSLTADDWAILLHATEKTQVPILKRAIDIARSFFDPDNHDDDIKNHILACTVLGIINCSDTSASKSDKVKGVLTTFKTSAVNLDVMIDGTTTLRKAITMNYGSFTNEEGTIKFLQTFIKNDLADSLAISKQVTYTMQQFLEAVQFATFYEGSISSQRIQEYTSTLITRLQALNDGIQGKILTKTEFESVEAYVNDLLDKHQIVNIDISLLDDSSAEVVTKVLSKLLLDHLKRMDSKAAMPINFIIEEAHRFVRNESNYGVLGYNIFERIAKEGRKFGLLMGISSQRPSELSKTVVSQCSNFIIHRVQNPDDLYYIAKMVPYVNQGMIDRLTYLQTGHALVFGTAINLPTLTKFEQASPKPDSDNAKISEKWYIE
ncbi:MAG: ATP-binding protein [Clostridiales bacterium]|nr:ATP-binding protein [Clostridiales bacterium]